MIYADPEEAIYTASDDTADPEVAGPSLSNEGALTRGLASAPQHASALCSLLGKSDLVRLDDPQADASRCF